MSERMQKIVWIGPTLTSFLAGTISVLEGKMGAGIKCFLVSMACLIILRPEKVKNKKGGKE